MASPASIPPLDLAHYCGRAPNMMPELKPMTLSFLVFPPELRNRVYELLLAETCPFNRAIFPSHHVPEDGRYAPEDDDDDDGCDSSDDSDVEMYGAPMTEEEIMELEEEVKSLFFSKSVFPGRRVNDDAPPKGYEYVRLDRDQCESVGGCLSMNLALPFMWTCKQIYEELGSVALSYAPYITAGPCADKWLLAMPCHHITSLELELPSWLCPDRVPACTTGTIKTAGDAAGVAATTLALVVSRCPNLEELRLWVNSQVPVFPSLGFGMREQGPLFWWEFGTSVMDRRWEDESIHERELGQYEQHEQDGGGYTSSETSGEFITARRRDMALARVERDLYVNKLWPALKALPRLRSLTIGGIDDVKWLGAVAKDLNIEILLAQDLFRPMFDVEILERVDPRTGKISPMPWTYATDEDEEAMDLDTDEESDETNEESETDDA